MNKLTVALYARVSMEERQDPENQLLQLKKWATNNADEEILQPFVDEISSRDTRPQKEEVLRLARTGRIDKIVVVSLSRWGRSADELVVELKEFQQRGISLISLREGFTFDTAAGRMFANLLAVLADFERDLTRERVLDGLHRAKVSGKIRGRHPRDCGCGWRDSETGKEHSGSVKPVRDEHNVVVAWTYADGRTVQVNHVRSTHKVADKPPLQTPGRRPGGS